MIKKSKTRLRTRYMTLHLVVITGVVLIASVYLLFNLPGMKWLPIAIYSNGTAGLVKNDDSLKSKEITEMNTSKQIRVHFYNLWGKIKGQPFERCQYKCVASREPGAYLSADAVVFHGPRLHGPPPRKVPGQIWIIFGRESPIYHKDKLERWTNLFNWTFSYRRDSDVSDFWGSGFHPKDRQPEIGKRDKHFSLTTNWNTKDRMAAWFVSRCNTQSRRREYAMKLKKSFDVHIYGNCGDRTCPRDQEQKCREILRKHYKFYLAFENSLCLDYVSEKSLKVFTSPSDTIPVMRGKGNYSLFFPPGSYLDTKDFSKVKDLAKEMMAIAANQNKAEIFFTWKTTYNTTSRSERNWCELCKRLHNPNKYKRLYHSMHDWAWDKPRDACREPTDVV